MTALIEQDELRRALAQNIEERGFAAGDLVSERIDPAWVRRFKETVGTDRGHVAAVVVADFEPQDYLRGLRAFVEGIDPDRRHAWYSNFTKALYLVGRPPRIASRIALAARSPSDRVAWVGPGAPARIDPVVRLLRPLRSRGRVALPEVVDCPGTANTGGPRLELRIDLTRTPTLEAYLIVLGHAIAETLCENRLDADDPLRVRHVAGFAAMPPRARRTWINLDPCAPDRLALLASLDELDR
jgi:Family of unknown function (DUF6182)